jgi:hypothetical protein
VKYEDRLIREDSLASWRLATLLTFNGFLVVALTDLEAKSYDEVIKLVPVVGIVFSLSVLAVSLLSANVKWKLHDAWPQAEGVSPITETKNKWAYYVSNIFGPYILSPLIVSVFWLVVLIKG